MIQKISLVCITVLVIIRTAMPDEAFGSYRIPWILAMALAIVFSFHPFKANKSHEEK